MVFAQSDFFKLDRKLTEYSAEKAVELFNDLLCCEALRIGIPLTNINCPQGQNINCSDGGIDAIVECPQGKTGDIIIDKLTCYQIKTDKKIPWNESAIVKELFNCSKKELSYCKTEEEYRNLLKPAIKNVLENDGTYVFVSFRHTFVQKNRDLTEKLVSDYFRKAGFLNTKVKVWGYEQLNIVIEQNYPALTIKIKNVPGCGLKNLIENVICESDLRGEYYADEKRFEIIKKIQDKLKTPNKGDTAEHIRILGASGMGKTKTVLEALSQDNLKNLCLFFESPGDYKNSGLLDYLLSNKDINLILIIDECDSRDAGEIFNKLEYYFPNIKLITIYQSCKKDTDKVLNENYLIIDGLDNEQMSKIIFKKFPSMPEINIRQIVRLCEGFPRAAIIVANNINNNPENYLYKLDDIWKKYVSNKDSKDSNKTVEKLRILRELSIYEKVGCGGNYVNELNFIKNILDKEYNLKSSVIDEYIKELKNNTILRGESSLYISPRIFQNWLKKEWWDTKEAAFNYEDYTRDMPDSLKIFFDSEFMSCSEDIKKKLVNSQFEKFNDLISKQNLLNCIGYTRNECLFNKLEKIIFSAENKELDENGRNIQELILHYALIPKYFERCANMLFRIALCESKKYYSNTAQTLFADLFTIFYNNDLANTHTALQNKIEYIVNQLNKTKNKVEVLLLLKAIKRGLENPHNVDKVISSDHKTISIVRIKDSFKYSNVETNYIEKLFEIIFDILAKNNEKEVKDECVKIFSQTTTYLLLENQTFEIALKNYGKFIKLPECDICKLFNFFENSYKYDWVKKLNKKNKKEYDKFYKELKNIGKIDDFKSFCINNSYIKKEQEEKFEKLIKNTDFSQDNIIEFLLSKDCQMSYLVGKKIAVMDNSLTIYKNILKKFTKLNPKNIDLILGYFNALCYSKDKSKNQKAEDLILDIGKNSPYYKILPDIISSAASDKTVCYLFSLIKKGKFPIYSLKYSISKCSMSLLNEIINYILEKYSNDINALQLCIGVIFYNFFNEKTENQRLFDKEIVFKCIQLFFETKSENQYTSYYQIQQILYKYADKKTDTKVLKNIFNSILNNYKYYDEYLKLCAIHLAKLKPKEMFNLFSKILESFYKEKNYYPLGFHGLWSENGLFEAFNTKDIKDWVKKDYINRAVLIAKLAPDGFLPFANIPCNAFYRDLIIQYPQNEKMLIELHRNSFSGSFEGKMSDNIKNKIEKIKELIEKEKEYDVISWLNQELENCNVQLERELELEERNPFYN